MFYWIFSLNSQLFIVRKVRTCVYFLLKDLQVFYSRKQKLIWIRMLYYIEVWYYILLNYNVISSAILFYNLIFLKVVCWIINNMNILVLDLVHKLAIEDWFFFVWSKEMFTLRNYYLIFMKSKEIHLIYTVKE